MKKFNFKRVITMGIAAVIAVSAMSISAFAAENSDNAVVSILAPDGKSMIYLSDKDIENGYNTVEGYNGITFKIEKSEPTTPLARASRASTSNFNNSTAPTAIKSIDNGIFSGNFSVGSYATKYSRFALTNGNSRTVLMRVEPDSAFNNKVDFNIYLLDDIKLLTLNPTDNLPYTITPTFPINSEFYVKIYNRLSKTASGYIELSAY